MDDPWGSPWATADSQPQPSAASSPERPLEAPPAVFLSAPAATLSLPSSQSPWADDDAFGDWNSAERAPASLGWGVWETATTPRPDHSRKPSLVAWPGSASPSQSALVLPHSAGTSRHPSPDPWANDRFDRQSPSKPISPLPSLDLPPILPTLSLESADDPTEEVKPNEDRPTEDVIPDKPKKTRKSVDTLQEDVIADGRSSNDHEGWHCGGTLDSAISTGDTMPPGPPSGSSSDSGFDEPEGASPATSSEIDRDEGSPSGAKETQVSKVRDLVDMYDGLSRKKRIVVKKAVPASRSRQGTPVAAEDAVAEPSASGHGEEGDLEPLHEKEPHSPRPASTENEPPGSILESIASRAADETKQTAIPAFQVDLTLLGTLFPESEDDMTSHEEDVTDQIIRDSFASISERKLWYRIGRLGSLRKHDSGEDDNYTRITWPSSTVRLDVIKIVRRWMEEYSMGSRMTLGGGAGRATASHMFGWDSNAAPVQLDAVFRRKASRESPRAPMNPLSTRNISGAAKTSWTPTSPVAVASFGWSSPSTVQPPAPFEATRMTKASQAASSTPLAAPTMGTSNVPSALTAADTVVGDGNDDDEWGEMVDSAPNEDSFAWGETPVKPAASPAAAPASSLSLLGILAEPLPATAAKPSTTRAADGLDIMSPHNRSATQAGSMSTDSIMAPKAVPPKDNVRQPPLASHFKSAAPASEVSILASSKPDIQKADFDTAQRIVRALPDLSYMLR